MDASGVALGGVVLVQEANCQHPVAYYSHNLNDAKKRYSTIDHKMLAIVDCLRHF